MHRIETHLTTESVVSYQHIDEELALKDTTKILSDAILKLPPQRRVVYQLCKIEGKTYEDVGRILGISTSTVSDHIVKATKALKTYYLAKHAITLACLFHWL